MSRLRLIEMEIRAGNVMLEFSHETTSKVKHYERSCPIGIDDRDEDLVYYIRQAIRSILDEINNESSRD